MFPISVAGGNLIAFLLIFLWVISGSFKNKIIHIIKNKFVLASLLFFLLHLLSLSWADDVNLGLGSVKKMLEFGVLIPALTFLFEKKRVEIYLNYFLVSVFITVVISFLVFFGMPNPFINDSDVLNPVAFSSHVTQGPIVAIGYYVSMRFLLFLNSEQFKAKKTMVLFYVFLSLLSAANVFILEGRAGYVVFFIVNLILFIQRFNLTYKSLMLFALTAVIFLTLVDAYSPKFHNRTIETIESAKNLSQDRLSSLGRRYTMAENTLNVFKENPLVGVGSGNLPIHYEKSIKSSKIDSETLKVISKNTKNPHNMYLLTAAELGVLGLFFLLHLFYRNLTLGLRTVNKLKKDIAVTSCVIFFLMNFSESYFLGHFTTFLYAFLASLSLSKD